MPLFNCESTDVWQVATYGYRIGTTSAKVIVTYSAVLDSGTSWIYIPQAIGTSFITTILTGRVTVV